VVGALLALVAASVGVFHAALGLSWVDAFYFVVTTVTTTGYGDINLQNASPFLKLYGSAVMISGCLLFAVLFSVFTDLILRTRIGDLMARGFSTTQGHSVVVGLGRVGMRVLDFLSRHRETLVTVEKDEKGAFVEQARRKSHLLIGDAQRPDTLRRAGIAGARVVVALTDDDLTNLRVALLVKRANPNCRVVTRIFDPTLAARVPATLGVDAVLSLADTAPTFVGVALSEDVIRGFVVGDRLFLLVRKVVSETGRKESGGGERLLLRRQGSGPFRPVPASGIEAGDEVIGVRWMAIGAET
jgi:voltage-gated potassium channel Kch